ncbi:hypothetical protein RUND412_004002 [Rhizina undulata]
MNQQRGIELSTVRFSKTPMSFNRFIAEIGATDALLDMLRESIATIKASHEANLGSCDLGRISKDTSTHDLQTAVARGFSLVFRFKHILSSLEEDVLYTEMAMDLHGAEDKKVMALRARKKLKQAVQAWENVESLYKKRFLSQMKTEILIVHPDASQEEVDRIIKTQESKTFCRAIKRIAVATSSSIKASISARNAELQELETSLKGLSDFLRDIDQQVDMDFILARGPPTYLNQLENKSVGHRKPTPGLEKIRTRIYKRRKIIYCGLLVALLIVIAVSVFAGMMITKFRMEDRFRRQLVRGNF